MTSRDATPSLLSPSWLVGWVRASPATWARRILVVLPWPFIGYALKDVTNSEAWNADARWMLGPALFLFSLSVLLQPVLWVIFVHQLSKPQRRASWLALLSAFGRSRLARYLPGRLWVFGGRYLLAKDTGVPGGVIARSLVYDFFLALATRVSLGSALLVLFLAGPGAGAATFVAVSVILGLPLVKGARFSASLARMSSRRLPGSAMLSRAAGALESLDDLSPALAARFGMGYLLSNALALGAFVLIVRAFADVALEDVPLLAAAYAWAGVAGYFAFVPPAGLGVREGILLALLGPIVTGPVAASVALLMRLITLFADLCLFSMGEGAEALWRRQPSLEVPSR